MSASENTEEVDDSAETWVSIGMAANWITMLLRQYLVVTSAVFCLSLHMKDAKTTLDKGMQVLEAVGILAMGIGPLWTKPRVTAQRLSNWKLTPYQFTGLVMAISTVLVGLGAYFFFALQHYVLVMPVLFINSVLVNEIKYSEAYFATNWLPKNKYYQVVSKSLSVANFITFTPIALVCIMKTPWFFIPIPICTLFLAYFIYFELEKHLNQETKYKQQLEINSDFVPLAEWNDPRSYEFYSVDLRGQSRLFYYTYYFLQFL